MSEKYIMCLHEFFDACFQSGQQYFKDDEVLSIAEEEQRLTVSVQGVPIILADLNEERHGPLMTPSERKIYEKLKKNYKVPRDELEVFGVEQNKKDSY